jgi:hypothetical protein
MDAPSVWTTCESPLCPDNDRQPPLGTPPLWAMNVILQRRKTERISPRNMATFHSGNADVLLAPQYIAENDLRAAD